jgi:hypothetical protein
VPCLAAAAVYGGEQNGSNQMSYFRIFNSEIRTADMSAGSLQPHFLSFCGSEREKTGRARSQREKDAGTRKSCQVLIPQDFSPCRSAGGGLAVAERPALLFPLPLVRRFRRPTPLMPSALGAVGRAGDNRMKRPPVRAAFCAADSIRFAV